MLGRDILKHRFSSFLTLGDGGIGGINKND